MCFSLAISNHSLARTSLCAAALANGKISIPACLCSIANTTHAPTPFFFSYAPASSSRLLKSETHTQTRRHTNAREVRSPFCPPSQKFPISMVGSSRRFEPLPTLHLSWLYVKGVWDDSLVQLLTLPWNFLCANFSACLRISSPCLPTSTSYYNITLHQFNHIRSQHHLHRSKARLRKKKGS